MSKLIGNSPNQVPSNADLGSAAFLDKRELLLSRGSNISAIDAVVTKTASDVFVYDTSKDSDGGAWRKRTHHTSWYQEELNTSYRGSKREFPSVAVIVLEPADRLVIYDADDANLPMWMVFNVGTGTGGTGNSILGSCNLSSTCAMNGQIVVTDNGGAAGTYLLNFIPDYTRRIGNSTTAGTTGVKTGGIAARNTKTKYDVKNPYAVIDWYANCSDITVLPNSKIDPETGLQKTTVAIGTNNDISIITSDDTILDIVGTSQPEAISHIAFTDNNKLVYCHGYACVYSEIPTTQDDVANYYNNTANYISRISNTTSHQSDGNPYAYGSTVNHVTAITGDRFAVAGNTSTSGFTITENLKSSDEYRYASITSDYNTGWIQGNINTALSPSDSGWKKGGELVLNSTFDSNTNNWDTVDSNNTITWSSGTMSVTRGGSGSSYVARTILNRRMRAGVKYVIRAYIVQDGGSGNNLIRLGSINSGYDRDVPGTTGTGYKYVTYTPTADISSLWIYAYPNQTTIVDDISVTVAEEDRGVFSDNFQVFEYGAGPGAHDATLKINSVTVGADTMAYQLPTSEGTFLSSYQDKNIGTGDFSISFWLWADAQGSGYVHCLGRASSPYGSAQSSSTGFTLKFQTHTNSAGWIPYFYSGNGNDNGTYNGSNDVIPHRKWTHVWAQRRAGRWQIYVNGKLTINGSTNSFSITDKFVLVGRGSGTEHGAEGQMALIKHTYDSASEEDIRKIYEDERHLFTENAKGRLYGGSGVVNGMAYDKKLDELHVGTANGRSVFQGLARKEYTTREITTAISAENGLVAEE